MMFSSAFRPPTVGLDIGSSAVKAVALKRGRAGWSLVAAGEAPLPEGSMQDGAAAEPTAVSEAVSQLLDSLEMRRARVASALSGHAVIVKRLSLPSMSQAELNDAIPWEAEQYIPFDLSEVQLDYQVVNSGADAAKSGLDVLLVAAKKDRIDDRAGVIAQTGRRAGGARHRGVRARQRLSDELSGADRSARGAHPHRPRRSRLCACSSAASRSSRATSRSAARCTSTRCCAISDRPASTTRPPSKILHGQFPADVNADQVAGILREASAQLVLEVRKTVDFYRATAPVEQLSRIVLSGGAWQAVGLVDLLASEFGAPVDVFDPFRRVTRAEPRDWRRCGRARPMRWPSASRCDRKATDDSRQPACHRTGRGAAARVAAERAAPGRARRRCCSSTTVAGVGGWWWSLEEPDAHELEARIDQAQSRARSA